MHESGPGPIPGSSRLDGFRPSTLPRPDRDVGATGRGLKAERPGRIRQEKRQQKTGGNRQVGLRRHPARSARPEYRQGATLGDDHKHWLRAKFFQQYRLFFRYHAPSQQIVFAWDNDEDSKRAYGSSDDAYRVFRKMLEGGHPPDDWNQLLAEAQADGQRLQQFANGFTP